MELWQQYTGNRNCQQANTYENATAATSVEVFRQVHSQPETTCHVQNSACGTSCPALQKFFPKSGAWTSSMQLRMANSELSVPLLILSWGLVSFRFVFWAPWAQPWPLLLSHDTAWPWQQYAKKCSLPRHSFKSQCFEPPALLPILLTSYYFYCSVSVAKCLWEDGCWEGHHLESPWSGYGAVYIYTHI